MFYWDHLCTSMQVVHAGRPFKNGLGERSPCMDHLCPDHLCGDKPAAEDSE